MSKTYEEISVDAWRSDLRILKIRGANPHCEGAPALIRYHPDGSIRVRAWYRDGLRHRDDGPAVLWFQQRVVFPGDTRTFQELNEANLVLLVRWWLNGRRQYKHGQNVRRGRRQTRLFSRHQSHKRTRGETSL